MTMNPDHDCSRRGVASAGDVTRELRNEKGQIVGTATRNGNQTTFRNDRGQVTGTSTTTRGGTTFYDSMGRQHGNVTRTALNVPTGWTSSGNACEKIGIGTRWR
jgi:hypothetical protein